MVEGVKIPQGIIELSKQKKNNHKTARQTDVYRDASNLKYLIALSMANAPRKFAKYFDEILVTASNAKQSLALALESGDCQSRIENLSFAKVLVEDIIDDAMILAQIGIISKERKKAIKRLAQKVSGQTVKLRDYFNSQGIDINGKTL